MYLCILGRQPKISLAELESLFGSTNVTPISPNLATVDTSHLDLDRLGGTIKAGQILDTPPIDHLRTLPKGKLTIGISDYRTKATAHTAAHEAIKLKGILKRHGYSVRTIPNTTAILSTATSHHNHLGNSPNKIELIYFEGGTALSTGTQNITAYAKRDQARPARDARVGMLPPKLAQILINLAIGQLKIQHSPTPPHCHSEASAEESTLRILDPFCGTGTILQETILMGYSAYGTDLDPRMINFSQRNLDWLLGNTALQRKSGLIVFEDIRQAEVTNHNTHSPQRVGCPASLVRSSEDETECCDFDIARGRGSQKPLTQIFRLDTADATTFTWQQPIDALATETYLGQPFSAPPADLKLKQVQQTVKHIILSFLKNIHPQISKNTPLALTIPAWKRMDGTFSHLNILDEIQRLGYNVVKFQHTTQSDLLYYRENQIVAREIIVLTK